LAGNPLASDWRKLLLLANFFLSASSLVDYLFNRIPGVGRRLIDLFTIPNALVVGKIGDSFFNPSFDLVDFGIHWTIHLKTKKPASKAIRFAPLSTLAVLEGSRSGRPMGTSSKPCDRTFALV
jgi:hypothetical protein